MSGRPFLEPGQTPPAQPPRFPSKPAPGRPPRRRGLLAAVAALTAPPAIVEAAQPDGADAVLLAACAAHLRTVEEERRLHVAMMTFDIDDRSSEARAAEEAWSAAGDRSGDALAVVMDLQAATLAGVAAKARAVMIYWRSIDLPTPETINFEERGALSVLADLERMAGGAL